MAQAIKNPRKAFNFKISFPKSYELSAFGVQECTLPDSEIEEVMHGFGNTEIKTAGIVKTGSLKISRIVPISTLGNETKKIFQWHLSAQDPYSQSGGDPDVYKKVVTVEELDNAGFGPDFTPVVIGLYTVIGVWPRLINGREYKRGESANVIESVEFSVDYMVPGAIS